MLSSKLAVNRVVVDTNVLIGALIGRLGYNRQAIRACFDGRFKPLVGQALFLEYEDVMGREALVRNCPLSPAARREFFAAFLIVSEWVQDYDSWRANLMDEADNHVVELAVAGGARTIVTNNIRDFRRAELRFPSILTVTPRELMEDLR